LSTGFNFEPKKILAFRMGHLGDTLVALPAFWTLRKAYPDAHITLLSNISHESSIYPTPRGVIPAEGLFNGWISYPTQVGKLAAVTGFAKLFYDIRAGGFDTLAYLAPRMRQPYQVERDLRFFNLAGIKQHVGTKYLLENFIPNTGLAFDVVLERESDYLLKCLTEEGITENAAGSPTELLLSEEEQRAATNWLREKVGDNYSELKLVAVAPGSKWESKLWPGDNFTELLSRLITNKNIFPVIFGGAEDLDSGERIINAIGKGANAAGALNIREAASALSRCTLYVGNDTGTMHLAAAVGVPCVAIFSGITYAGSWDPFGEGNIIFRKIVHCQGCNSAICKFNRECMETSVDEVYEACVEILNRTGRR
jgi:heptosyltransferase-3